MVKKLFKYEIMSYLKTVIPFEIIVLAAALFTRVIQFFKGKSSAYSIVETSSEVLLGISIVVSLVMVFVVAIVRFYKNLYSKEGYLTLMLPVKPCSHIWVKVITAVAFTIVSAVISLVAIIISCAGELSNEIFKALGFINAQILKVTGAANFYLYIAEIVLVILSILFALYLLCYSCISLGQLAKKNRVLMAFVVYLIYYFATQVIGTILIIVCTFNSVQKLILSLLDWAEKNIMLSVHLGMSFIIVANAVLIVAYFLINRYILTKKVNLE